MKRIAAALAGLALTGCAYNMTLYPTNGGTIGTGTTNRLSFEVSLDGETYRGDLQRGQSAGMILGGNTPAVRPMFSVDNGFSGIATSGSKTVECHFVIVRTSGSGQCQDSGGHAYNVVLAL